MPEICDWELVCVCVRDREKGREMAARRGMISRKRYTCEIPQISKQLHNVS